MGFREFISNFRYRRQVESGFKRFQNIKPPKNPSRRYVDKLVRRLLKESAAWDARRELSMMGAAAVPSLLAALYDPRFQQIEREGFSQVPAPLEALLELLVSHAGDDVVKVTTPLVNSPSAAVRKRAALYLSSVGRADTIPLLELLLRDEDGYVRSYVRIGIHRAATEGRAEDAFRREAYDLLLSQCDQQWEGPTNDAAETVVALDPERAAADLADGRFLDVTNRNVHNVLEACTRGKVLLPEDSVRRLLDSALPLASGERCYPNDYVVAAGLGALALHGGEHHVDLARSLLTHDKDKVKEAAAAALATLTGVSDPTGFVIDLVHEKGYTALTHAQRVVYCAFLFDTEVCNGGLMQFFGNSSGDHVADTLDALAELGHDESHTALRTAIKLVGPLALESDRDLRLTGFEGRWDELQSAFAPLETAYYATQAGLRQAWLLYAVRHADQFRR